MRDIYDCGDTLLIVATDRISAFDVVLPDGIPCKGAVLSQMSAYWFAEMREVIDNHFISADPAAFPPALPGARGDPAGKGNAG